MNGIKSKIIRITSHSFVRQSAIVMGSSVVSNAGAYLYHLFIGRILGPQGYGELAALLSLFYIINVPSAAILNVLTKYFSEMYASRAVGQMRTLIIKATQYIVIGVVVGALIMLLFVNAIANYLHIQSPASVFFLYLTFGIFLLNVVTVSALTGAQRFFDIAIYTNIGMILRLGLGIVGAFFGVFWTVLANTISNIVSYVLFFFPLRSTFNHTPSRLKITFKGALGYSIPTILATLGITSLFSTDLILVKHYFSPQAAGIYASLSVLGKAIYFLSYAITSVLFPKIAERVSKKKPIDKYILVSALSVGGLSSIATLLYFLFPEWVVLVLFGEKFMDAVPYVGMFGVFITFFTLSNIFITACLAAHWVNMWILPVLAAVFQMVTIMYIHDSLMNVIVVNTLIAATLTLTLMFYTMVRLRYNSVKQS